MSRNSDLAKIHIACKQLGIDKDAYRDMLFTIARVRSAADLDEHGRNQVIEHLKASGATFKKPGIKKRATPALDKAALTSKIMALMSDLPVPHEYVDAMALRMFGLGRWEFATPQQMHKLAAALVYAQKRRDRAQKKRDAEIEATRKEMLGDNA